MNRRALLLGATIAARAQQVPDDDFDPPIPNPAHAPEAGPIVAIDEAHHNFHTAHGRYATFAKLLSKDGYRVQSNPVNAALLVIANALHPDNAENWDLPNPPAFSPSEIARIESRVAQGGALLLIVDHQPFPGAAATLSAAFGARFHNGYAIDPPNGGGQILYTKASGRLRPHPITQGVENVLTFQGSAFEAPSAQPLLVYGPKAVSYISTAPGRPAGKPAQTIPIPGWLQAAAIEHGRGRVAIFAEAAMFSAQLAGPQRRPMGMNHPGAAGNVTLLRNLARWLTRG